MQPIIADVAYDGVVTSAKLEKDNGKINDQRFPEIFRR